MSVCRSVSPSLNLDIQYQQFLDNSQFKQHPDTINPSTSPFKELSMVNGEPTGVQPISSGASRTPHGSDGSHAIHPMCHGQKME